MKNMQMVELNANELEQIDGGSWWGVAGGVVLGGLLLASGIGGVAALVAGAVYAVECEMVGA